MEYPTLQNLIESKINFSYEEQDFLSTIEKRSKVIDYVYSILGETKIDIITPLDPEILDQAEKFYYDPGSADTDFGQMRTKRARKAWLATDLPRYMGLYSSYLRRNGGK